jgi:hypothetical protein
MTTVAEVMKKASILLLDESFVRWPLSEMALWINEAINAIALAKPTACSQTIVFQLQAGTLQELPDTYDSRHVLALLGVNRNVTSAVDDVPPVGGRVIRTVARNEIDAQNPLWHVSTDTPFRAEVRNVIFDENSPTQFYVYPGNDGTGKVEAVVSLLPATILVDTTEDPDLITSWETMIPLPEPYSVPVLDYLLFRCFGKDDTGADLNRSAVHYQAFATAVGLKVQTEQMLNPNRRKA